MDAVYKTLIAFNILCLLAIVIMLYNRIKWDDELHGLFNYKRKREKED